MFYHLRFIFLKLLLLGLVLTSFSANGAIIEMNLTCSVTNGDQNLNALLQTACAELKSKTEEEANAQLPDVDLDEFSKGFANAAVMSTKGTGSDYANDFTLFVLSAGAGIGIDLQDTSVSSLSNGSNDVSGGVALMPHLTLGVNLGLLPISKIGPIDFSKMDLFLNAFSYKLNQDQDDFEVEGELKSFGAFVRYDLYDPISFVPGGLVRWGGLQLHTGYQYNKMDLDITSTQDFEEEENLGGSESSTTISLEGEVEAAIKNSSTIHTIPIEVSTSIQLIYVFSLYGGLGTDFNFGSNKVEIEADGTFTEASNNSNINIDGNLDLDDDETAKPDNLFFRGFIGTQFNIPFFKIYAEAHRVFGKNAYSAHLGFKLLF